MQGVPTCLSIQVLCDLHIPLSTSASSRTDLFRGARSAFVPRHRCSGRCVSRRCQAEIFSSSQRFIHSPKQDGSQQVRISSLQHKESRREPANEWNVVQSSESEELPVSNETPSRVGTGSKQSTMGPCCAAHVPCCRTSSQHPASVPHDAKRRQIFSNCLSLTIMEELLKGSCSPALASSAVHLSTYTTQQVRGRPEHL